MLSYPTLISLNKDKILIATEGNLIVRNSPELKLIVPMEWAMRAYRDRKLRTAPRPMEKKYYFTGRHKYSINENSPTNVWDSAAIVTLNHEEWKDGMGRFLPFSYTDYMLITEEPSLRALEHKKDLKLMYFDIEVASDGTGMFPRARRNAVAMVGLKCNYDADFSDIDITKTSDNIYIIECYDSKSTGMEDLQILTQLDKAIEVADPDVLVTYHGWRFDMPYILERLQILGLQCYGMQGITEEQVESMPNIKSHYIHCKDIENSFMPAVFGRRVHYDIFNVDVLRDQKLTGKVKNKKMKTIAAYFYKDADDIVLLDEPEMENIRELMESKEGRATLKTYLHSDVIQTERICDIYFKSNNVDQAEALKVPLSVMVGRRSGTIPTLYILKEMFQNKMVPLSTNASVYDELIHRASNDFNEEKFFQGAYVDILRIGKIPRPIYKSDFSCVDEDTETLTKEGWKHFRHLKVGEEIITFNKEKEYLEWQPCDHLYAYPYDGEIFHTKTSQVDIKVTPNHRVTYIRGRAPELHRGNKARYSDYHQPGIYRTCNMDNLPTYIKIPVASTIHQVENDSIMSINLAELIGYIISEGSMLQGGIAISQCNPPNESKVNRIRELLHSVMLKDKDISEYTRYREKTRSIEHTFRIKKKASKPLLDMLDNYIHKIPKLFLLEEPLIILALVKGLVAGDGSIYPKGIFYFCTSIEDNADIFQALASITGTRCIKNKSRHHESMYYCYCSDNQFAHLGLSLKHPTKDSLYVREHYIGNVYCATVNNGYMLCRRKGKSFITGNSLYPNIIRTFNLSYETLTVRFEMLREREYCHTNVAPGETIVDRINDGTDNYRVRRLEKDGKPILEIAFNDKILHVRVIVSIDMSRRGLIPSILDKVLTQRAEVRKRMENLDKSSVEYAKLDSSQSFLKIVANSVLDFEEVLCYNIDMQTIEIMTIATLYNRIMKNPTSYLACTCDHNCNIGWSSISRVWRHLIKKGSKVWKITIKYGSSIYTTGDHSIMLLNDSKKMYSKPTKEIELGEKVAYARSIATDTTEIQEVVDYNTIIEVDIDKWIKENGGQKRNVYIAENMRPIFKKNKTGKYVASFILHMNSESFTPLNERAYSKIKTVRKLELMGIIESRISPKGNCYIRKEYKLTSLGNQAKFIMEYSPVWDVQVKCFKILNAKSINMFVQNAPNLVWGIDTKQPNKFNPYPLTLTLRSVDEAYALGAYVAEGHISRTICANSYRGIISQKIGKCDKERIKRGLDSLFKTRHTITKNGITIMTWYEAMVLDSLFGKYSGNKTIDSDFINDMSISKIHAFLDGYFDGDGNLLSTGLRRFSSKSLHLIERIKYMMNRIGRSATINSKDTGCYRLVETIDKGIIGKEVIAKEELTISTDQYVYDICVPGNETFIMANGIVSHNSTYGILAQRTGIGYLPIGLTITAMGRWATMTVTNELGKPNTPLLEKNQLAEW